jgi:hypothetical protein
MCYDLVEFVVVCFANTLESFCYTWMGGKSMMKTGITYSIDWVAAPRLWTEREKCLETARRSTINIMCLEQFIYVFILNENAV